MDDDSPDPAGDRPGSTPYGPFHLDIGAVRLARRARPGERAAGERPTIAVVADRPDDTLVATLAASGWDVRGVLAGDVFDGLLWASRFPAVRRNYASADEVLGDPELDAAYCRPGPGTGLALATALLGAGLHVLLPDAGDVGASELRVALEAADEADAEHAVVLPNRWAPGPTTASALAVDGELGSVHQVTVRGWPTGAGAVLDLADLIRDWCGEIVAVTAHAEQLPAATLPGGAAVRWALLTERGTTVLVSHEGAPVPTVRLTCAAGRLQVTADAVGWLGGPAVDLVTPPVWAAEAEPGLPRLPVSPPPEEASPGLVATAHRLALAALTGDGGFVGSDAYGGKPAAATLRDVLVLARVRDALRASALHQRWVEIG